MMDKFKKIILKKETWTSDIWLVEMSDKILIYLWTGYLVVQAIKNTELFTNLLTVILERLSWISLPLSPRPIEVLLSLTLIYVFPRVWYLFKKKNYKELDSVEFPEYNFDFQEKLVKFLNEANQYGQNIYWLDGAWGTGKTHFIRTFFEKQRYKAREIYYISCFGIKPRNQAEQVLQSEIESRSRLSIFTSIPVIGSLISWGFSASGLGLMKKDGIIIFDDLERVVYNETENDKETDNPKDYNDLLGFIDYLANYKNQKVIVVYNSEDIPNTHKLIMKKKFIVSDNQFPLTEQSIEKIVNSDDSLSPFYKEFLIAIFKLRLVCGDNNSRKLLAASNNLRDKSDKLAVDIVVDYLNSYVRDVFDIATIDWCLDNLSGSLVMTFDGYPFYSPFYTSIISRNYYTDDLKKKEDRIERTADVVSVNDKDSFDREVNDRKRKAIKFYNLMDIIWKKEEFRDIVYVYNESEDGYKYGTPDSLSYVNDYNTPFESPDFDGLKTISEFYYLCIKDEEEELFDSEPTVEQVAEYLEIELGEVITTQLELIKEVGGEIEFSDFLEFIKRLLSGEFE